MTAGSEVVPQRAGHFSTPLVLIWSCGRLSASQADDVPPGQLSSSYTPLKRTLPCRTRGAAHGLFGPVKNSKDSREMNGQITTEAFRVNQMSLGSDYLRGWYSWRINPAKTTSFFPQAISPASPARRVAGNAGVWSLRWCVRAGPGRDRGQCRSRPSCAGLSPGTVP